MLTETKRVENHDRVVALLNSVERDGVMISIRVVHRKLKKDMCI